MWLAKEHPRCGWALQQAVVSSKQVVGSLDPTFIEVQVRQIEIIPKSDMGSWRLRVDLWAPN